MTHTIELTRQCIRALVLARDGHRCTCCGFDNVAHMRRYGMGLKVCRMSPDPEFSVRNCSALCLPCQTARVLGQVTSPA